MLQRLGEAVARHARWVIAGWFLATLVGAGLASGLSKHVANRGFDVHGSSSERAHVLVQRYFPGLRGSPLFIAATSADRDPSSLEAALVDARRALATDRKIRSVGSVAVSRDGRAAVLPFTFDEPLAAAQDEIPGLATRAAAHAPTGVDVQVLGEAAVYKRYSDIASQDLKRAESLSFPAPLIMLLLAFLSVVAAALPVAAGMICLVVVFGGIYLISLVTATSVFVENVASILGIGLSIDFSLFSVSRFRELTAAPDFHPPAAAAAMTVATTGRAILLSGLTVAASLSLLFTVDVALFSSIGFGAILAALVAAGVGLTFVPAVLVVLGPRLDKLALRSAPLRTSQGGVWRRIARWTTRRPVAAVVSSTAVLVLLALPATHISIVSRPTTELPSDDSIRRSAEAVGRSFGSTAADPAEIVTRSGQGAATDRVSRAIAADPGVRGILGVDRGTGGWVRLRAALTHPASPKAYATVRRVRRTAERIVPQTYVGGQTAELADLVDRIEARAPYIIAGSLVLGALILGFGLQSIVIPIKAALTTGLSVAAGIGVVNFLFTDIGGQPGLGYFVPLVLFTIVFGLSIDYESFLISRIREEVRAGRSNEDAVREGLTRTGRAITLAGAVIITVFAVFAAARLAPFQELGVGLTVAVLLDVTIVRLLLVPGTLVLLGDANWWLPRRRRARVRQ